MAPVIPSAHRLDTVAMMVDLRDLVGRARSGRLSATQMVDPTITVTNLGDRGADTVFGVIYPPQVAMVGFGAVALTPMGGPWCGSPSMAGHRHSGRRPPRPATGTTVRCFWMSWVVSLATPTSWPLPDRHIQAGRTPMGATPRWV